MTQRVAAAHVMILLMSLTAGSAHALDAAVLEGIGGCLFDPACVWADRGSDGRVSAADVVAALREPRLADPMSYTRVFIAGDPSPSGVFDPSVVFPADDSAGWMAYSGVTYRRDGAMLVREVSTHLARSDDGGASWLFERAVNSPAPATVTVGDVPVCGAPTCSGLMISEVPFLVDDAGDPDPRRRFKLFAHRFLLYPPLGIGRDTLYALGSINMRSAPQPDGPWSDDVALLGWPATPPEIPVRQQVTAIGGAAADCLALSEGTGLARDGALDAVFACPYAAAGGVRQRIILLRSTDHAESFDFAAVLLEADDAASLGAVQFSAPALAQVGGRVMLLLTPVRDGRYAGCAVVATVDLARGRIERDGAGRPVVRAVLPTSDGRFGGACAWNGGSSGGGIVISQLFAEGGNADPFRIFATGVAP